MSEHTGGSAFPLVIDRGESIAWDKGMTLRDYFAAKAMQAIVHEAEQFWEGAATLAYQYADAMLKARQE